MRMRKKVNLIPRMERCAHVQIKEPADSFGSWMKNYPNYEKLWLELGCGKGSFTVKTAEQNPKNFVVAVEKVPDAMVMAMEKATDMELENVRFIDADVLTLPVVFEENEVDRIFINFPDPWPRNRSAKLRLTSPRFLEIYEHILKSDGEIHFKTDNNPLFEYSLETMQAEGWTLSEVTRDLHKNGTKGVMTDYEQKFHEDGVKINRLVAKKEKK